MAVDVEIQSRPALRERFAREHRLREHRWSPRNVARVIRGGSDAEAVKAFVESIQASCWRAGGWEHQLAMDVLSGSYSAFDHPECWGRDRTPLVLVGHPYDLGRDRVLQLRTLAALGLDLVVMPASGWYGFGTYHVRVSVPGSLPPPTDAERFTTLVELDGD